MVLPGKDEPSQPSSGPAKMFQPETPVIIVARNLEIPEEMLRAAEEKQLAILKK